MGMADFWVMSCAALIALVTYVLHVFIAKRKSIAKRKAD
jgi:hypothetical protein